MIERTKKFATPAKRSNENAASLASVNGKGHKNFFVCPAAIWIALKRSPTRVLNICRFLAFKIKIAVFSRNFHFLGFRCKNQKPQNPKKFASFWLSIPPQDDLKPKYFTIRKSSKRASKHISKS